MTAPQITPGPALGTGGSASIQGSDFAGVIAVMTGATTGSPGQSPFGLTPVGKYIGYSLSFQPLDDATAALYGVATQVGMQLPVLAANTAYSWSYRAQFQGAGAALA